MPDLPHVRRKWQPIGQLWPILAAACFGLVVAICAWFAVSIWEERLSRTKFNNTAQDYAEVLQNGLDDYLSKIVAVRAFYEASVEVEPDEFALFTKQILDGQTDKMRILWCPHVTRQSALSSSERRSIRATADMPSRPGQRAALRTSRRRKTSISRCSTRPSRQRLRQRSAWTSTPSRREAGRFSVLATIMPSRPRKTSRCAIRSTVLGPVLKQRSRADLAGLPSWSGSVKAGDVDWNLVATPAKQGSGRAITGLAARLCRR